MWRGAVDVADNRQLVDLARHPAIERWVEAVEAADNRQLVDLARHPAIG